MISSNGSKNSFRNNFTRDRKSMYQTKNGIPFCVMNLLRNVSTPIAQINDPISIYVVITNDDAEIEENGMGMRRSCKIQSISAKTMGLQGRRTKKAPSVFYPYVP
jgi:hypothetical protein